MLIINPLKSLSAAAAIFIGLFCAISLLPGDSWFSDLLANFRLHLISATALLLIANLIFRNLRSTTVLSVLLTASLFQISTLFAGQSDSTVSRQESLHVVTFNLSLRSTDAKMVLSYLLEVSPDVIVLQEYTFKWHGHLGSLLETYPYVAEDPREGAFGIALLSKHPLVDAEISEFPGSSIPFVRTLIDYRGEEIEFVGVHLDLPLTPASFDSRNRQIGHLTSILADSPGNAIVCGDLNLTVWSTWYDRLLSDGNLTAARSFRDLASTWPSRITPLGLSIDHCLAQSPVSIVRRTVGPHLGSDHRPISYELSLPGLKSQ